MIEPGTRVLVRTAFGDELQKVAMTGVVEGHDFPVVWVAPVGAESEADPWPAEDVRVASPNVPAPQLEQSPDDAPDSASQP
jgi:hypothetical protein